MEGITERTGHLWQMTPGPIKARIFVEAQAKTIAYNGQEFPCAPADADYEIEIKLEAHKTRAGHIEDIRAFHGNTEIQLNADDLQKAIDELDKYDPAEWFEPDCGSMTIGGFRI